MDNFADDLDEADSKFRDAIKMACETSKSCEQEQRMIESAAAMHTAIVRMIMVRCLRRLLSPNPRNGVLERTAGS